MPAGSGFYVLGLGVGGQWAGHRRVGGGAVGMARRVPVFFSVGGRVAPAQSTHVFPGRGKADGEEPGTAPSCLRSSKQSNLLLIIVIRGAVVCLATSCC